MLKGNEMKKIIWLGLITSAMFLLSFGIANSSFASQLSNKTFPKTLTVTHGALVPGAGTHALDLGQPGASVGDQIVIYVPLSKPAGYLTGTLTTTALNVPKTGKQIRQARLSFNFSSTSNDTLEVQGTSVYEVISPTLSIGTRTVRAVVGGTGRYSGMNGYVVTTHPSADKWIHTFHLRNS